MDMGTPLAIPAMAPLPLSCESDVFSDNVPVEILLLKLTGRIQCRRGRTERGGRERGRKGGREGGREGERDRWGEGERERGEGASYSNR